MKWTAEMNQSGKIKNIFRVTIHRKDGSKIDGWQVRIVRSGLHVTKFFSCTKYGADGALAEAVLYRDSAKEFQYKNEPAIKKPSIFLSYAKEDKEKVQKIYTTLVNNGIEPWMDKPPSPYEENGLGAGQKWETILRKRIKESDYFMAFISNSSANKRGYVQNEIRQALKEMNNFPEDQVYLVPVLLEECQVPELTVGTIELGSLQWYELYKDPIEVLIKNVKKCFRSQ